MQFHNAVPFNLATLSNTIVTAIEQLLSNRPSPVVVALDGGSGAGKTTLALLIEKEFDTAIVQLDDFFSAHIPDRKWDEFSVEEKLDYVFDWQRLRESALEPLLMGK